MGNRRTIIGCIMVTILCMSYLAFGKEPVNAYAQDLSSYFMYGDWAYGTGGQQEEYVYIGGYAGEETTLTIPEEIDGKPVKEIEPNAFKDNTSLKSITIPDTVNVIGEHAFDGCIGLETVNIPIAITEIGEYAFFKCSSLESVTLPKGLIKIEKYAFSECNSLISVTIPASVKLSEIMGEFSFSKCEKLETVTLEDGIEYISEGMFYECPALADITIPDSVTRIEKSAFVNCDSLKNSAMLPNSIYSIDDDAFKGCDGFTYFLIPNSVKTIGNGAFSDCSKLETITLSSNLEYIWGRAFSCCTALDNVIIPDGVEVIGNEAFKGCSNLKSIQMPASIRDIYENAFGDCSEELTIHTTEDADKVILYAQYEQKCAFDYNLVEEYTIYPAEGNWKYQVNEDNTVTIVEYLEDEEEDLTIQIPGTIDGKKVTAIGDNTFLGKIHYKGGDPQKHWKIYIPDSVTKIGDSAFNSCVVFDLWIPADVTVISSSAFSGCMSFNVYTENGADDVIKYMAEKNIPCEIPATSIAFNKKTLTLSEGESTTLAVTFVPDSATNRILEWTSSDEDVVDVDSEGEISADSPGTATVTATITNGMTDEILTASCEITVIKAEEEDNKEDNEEENEQGSTESGDNNISSQGNENPSSNPPADNGTSTGTDTSKNPGIQSPGGQQTDVNKQPQSTPDNAVKEPSVSKVNNFKAAAKKKALNLSWKKVKGASGYQIQIGTKKNFKGAKTINIKKTKVKYTASKLKSSKKYYVQIRAYVNYKNTSGKTQKAYGKWTVLSKKTK